MNLPQSEQLNIERFSHLFENKSECYKLFWFKAILEKVCSGKSELTFDELINEMISDAWYMVTEYHLNLGPTDNLEKVVNIIKERTSLLPSAKKADILGYLDSCVDTDVLNLKKILIQNVPYRLQAPLFDGFTTNTWARRPAALQEIINTQNHLMYYFQIFNGLNTRIKVTGEWEAYIIKNQEILRGWTDYNMIIYLQKRNPSVPGISDKLYPPISSNLYKVRKYWKDVISAGEGLRDIYGNNLLSDIPLSIDHFVPWSYVAHDELWNLSPTTREINSMKSNHLPKWTEYFGRLAELEFNAYQIKESYPVVKDSFEKCAAEHLNNSDIFNRLYRDKQTEIEFKNQLSEIIKPVYKSAKNCGFTEWVYAS